MDLKLRMLYVLLMLSFGGCHGVALNNASSYDLLSKPDPTGEVTTPPPPPTAKPPSRPRPPSSVPADSHHQSTAAAEDHGPVAAVERQRNPTDMLLDAVKTVLVDVMKRQAAAVTTLSNWIAAAIQMLLRTFGFHGHREQRSSPDEMDLVVPILGRRIQYDDLHFLEKFAMDTMEAIKTWQRKKTDV